jgi:predicted ATPase/DNA-binding winged helix-turn-helix (wHTH) protein
MPETTPSATSVTAWRFGDCELRLPDRQLVVAGEQRPIGGRAFGVLLALVEGGGAVISKEELLSRAWRGSEVEENNLASQISHLRRLVGRDTIATVSGRGYRLATAARPLEWQVTSEPGATPLSSARSVPEDCLQFGDLEWSPAERAVRIAGQRAALRSRAIDLLGVLIAERHRVVSKQELLDRAWPGVVVDENNLQVQISTLRKALGQAAVATIPGRGYRFTLQTPRLAPDSRDSTASDPQPLTNLPHAAEALFGRDEELGELEHRLLEHRMLTIVGAGGIGKTRIAQALSRRQLTRFAHGAWGIDLGVLASPSDVLPAIAAAARVELVAGDPLRQLAYALAARKVLLVLDSCEHLIDEVSRVAAHLLDEAGDVWLLATSQEPLRVEREQVFRLGGLQIASAGASLDEARRSSAIMLLERRAQAVSGRFALTPTMLPAAIEICRQLDGIPLAIEMAAARLPQLGVAVLHNALGQRLHWLRSGLRAALPRHETLRATLDWSHARLGDPERAVLRRLAVFPGGFVLESAQQVARDETLDGWAVTEALATLVERSLVQSDESEVPRYRLLETVRLYALEQLEACGEAARTRAAHMRWMARIAEEAEQTYWTTPDWRWLARYAPEYADLHAAFAHACDVPDAAAGAAILDALYRVDELRVQPGALAARLPAARALLGRADGAAAMRIRLILASLFVAQVPVEGVSKLDAIRPAVDLARLLGDRRRLYRALLTTALHSTIAGEEGIAVAAIAEADALEDQTWPPRLKWFGAVHRTFCTAICGNGRAARSSARSELRYAEQGGSPVQALAARGSLADLALMCGDAREAIWLGMLVADEIRAAGSSPNLANVLSNLCAAFIAAGDLDAAAKVVPEAIELAWRYDRVGFLLDHLSLLAGRRGRFQDSLQLIGFADACWQRAQYVREGNEAADVQRAMALNEEALGAAEAARLRRLGAELDSDAARRLAESCVDEGSNAMGSVSM